MKELEIATTLASAKLHNWGRRKINFDDEKKADGRKIYSRYKSFYGYSPITLYAKLNL